MTGHFELRGYRSEDVRTTGETSLLGPSIQQCKHTLVDEFKNSLSTFVGEMSQERKGVKNQRC